MKLYNDRWGLMTLTTVGYGDLSPSTFPGKLIGEVQKVIDYIYVSCTIFSND